MREFAIGVRTLVRGVGFWRTIPRTMALSLIPAVIVVIAWTIAVVAFAFALPDLAVAATPFADSWLPLWAGALRTAVSLAALGAAFLLAATTTTALTLVIGEPFYDRVWRAVERATTGTVPEAEYGFWLAAGDAARLIARGALVALAAWLLSFIPVVGGIAGAVVGLSLTGLLLADELASRALAARGLDRAARRALLRGARARALGFGVATQACFLVPFGAIAVMPAAVAGSTVLAQDLLRLTRPSSPPAAAPAAPG